VKVILQSQTSECGLACIAMIANHFGHRTDLASIRRQFSVSLKGASLTSLINNAQRLGLQARALRLDLEDIGQLQTPSILHWNLNHFVVLKKVESKTVVILDPAFGERRVAVKELSERFTGVALELTPGSDFTLKNAPIAVKLSQLTGPIFGLWRSLSQIIALSMALQVFVLLAPFLMQWVVDQVLVSADRSLLAVLSIGFALALLLQIAIGWLRGWALIFLSTRLNVQWLGNVFAHAIRLPLDFFEKRHLGDIVSRMGALQSIQRTLTHSSVEVIIDGLMALATLGMMLLYSAKLALVTLLAVAIYLILRGVAFHSLRATTEQELVASSRQQTHLLETLRGIQSIKINGQESFRQNAYQNLIVDTVNEQQKLLKLNLGFASGNQAVFGIEKILVIWIGAQLAIGSLFSVGMLIAYLAYKEQFTQRVSGLIDRWIEFRMLRLHCERLADVVLSDRDDQASEASDKVPPSNTRIEVKQLSFQYAVGEPWVLNDCDFSIEQGESVAITGSSGCGKTSLIKLMLGLLRPTKGSVVIGGQDIHQFGLRNYRNIVGVVMQDDQLFAGSISENIVFGACAVDQEAVEQAARWAGIHDEIMTMPMAYNTLIGDMGTVLSGGQKQRVILARALFRKPKILFLDEATSHLDVEKERFVNDAVSRMKITRIIIAHRPETIASADRVLHMRDSRIFEQVAKQPPSSRCELAAVV
jgi:ATP-binding cassette, subfamily B, bacterial CvaB/MchF/RaxB